MNIFNTEEDVRHMEADAIPDNTDAYIDYRRMRSKNTIPDIRILVFLTGFCIGMVFFYFTRGDDNCIIEKEQMLWLQSVDMYQKGLLQYIFALRFKQLVFISICALSSIGMAASYLIMCWYGFEIGVIIFSFVYQYGIKGILLTFSMFLPHGLFYLIIFFIIFNKCWESNTKYYHKTETINNKKIFEKFTKFKKIIIIVLIFLFAILCETYVNPEIVRKISIFF